MIGIVWIDYSKCNELDIAITRCANDMILDGFEFFIDLLKENVGFTLDSFLPRDYLLNKPIECRRLVDELFEIISSDAIRDTIKPKYQYLLYSVIDWWIEIFEDFGRVPDSMSPWLREQIINNPDYIEDDEVDSILNRMTDYTELPGMFFEDIDFCEDSVSSMTMIYIQDKEIFELMFPEINIKDYEDLMPADIRELYNEKCVIPSINLSIKKELEIQIIIEINAVLIGMEQRIAEIEQRNEVELSNEIYGALKRILKVSFNIESTREMTIGRANKKLGETDLYLFQNDLEMFRDIAIIENKNVEDFNSQYKQLLGYLNKNFTFGVTISINRKSKFSESFDKVLDTLGSIKDFDSKFVITEISRPIIECPYIVRSRHKIPEDPSREMNIYHLIFNLYDEERKNIAKEARV